MLPGIVAINKALGKSVLVDCKAIKNKGGIDIGWLLPNRYAITAHMYDHKEILYALGLDIRTAFELDMVKKSHDSAWECTRTQKSLDTLKHDIMVNLTNFQHYDTLTVEVINVSSDYLFHLESQVYKFSIEDFKRQDYYLEKVLTDKYKIN